MSDGGLLVSTDMQSFNTYMKEEVDRYRVVIGNQTCVFEKGERSHSPQIPIRWKLWDIWLKMEVIAGAVLDAGALIARLELDDPSKVTTPDFHWEVPTEPVFQYEKAKEIIEKFMKALRDPTLPLLELQEVISSISGRIPASVEKKIRKLMTLYMPATLLQFWLSSQVSKLPVDCSTRSALQDGIRGRMKSAVQELLRIYLGVETQFQHGHYDKCVQALRDKHKDDMQAVTSCIFSHYQVAKKNIVVTMLIDHVWGNEPGLTDELAAILKSSHSSTAQKTLGLPSALAKF
ncbi:Acetyl-CoA carboxylase [Orchesella cincta]|uniref:Acetyl-CoA carboxylase n=1 Tax=Orchesella cincta TaxID=48709 RepID=A0A1D2NDF9_ORCCI|nr:Acetyl-CoA carboxylase [Orchesella cincta]